MAGDFDPGPLDLAALIECRVDVPSYNGFAVWLAGEPSVADTLGWKEVPSGNPFLRQQLARPGPRLRARDRSDRLYRDGPDGGA